MDALRSAAIDVLRVLRDAGHEAFLVGGCVRDRLLGLTPKDYDIATSAHPPQIEGLFPDSHFVGAKFGVALVRSGEFSFEVTTFRRDGLYVNHRHPETIDFGTMADDAARRDFTMNALYEDPITDKVVDLHGGRADLAARRLRCVGDPVIRFREDALRLLRAVRFAARFGFTVEPLTWQAMIELAPTIEFISPERHRAELNLILLHPSASTAIRLMDGCGLLHFLLPEVEELKGVEQGALYHPEGDVFVHTMLVLDHVEPRNEVTVWAALLHDIAKPATFRRDAATGKITFYDHARLGARVAGGILGRLRASNDQRETVAKVVARHMDFLSVPQMRASTLRRFLGAPTIEFDMAIHRADCLGSSGNLAYWNRCREVLAELAGQKVEVVPRPLLDGRALIQLGCPPGPPVGELLHALQEAQLNGEITSIGEATTWVRGRLEARKSDNG